MADDIPAKDLIFEDKTGETLIKIPGEIMGNDFMIMNLENCDVYLLDFTAQITIDDCINCRFLFGPCEGSVFLRDCKDVKMTAACGQFRLRDVTDSDFCLYATSEPSIETSTNVRFGPFNGGYPHLDEHFTNAKMETVDNKWSQVFDFNKPAEGRNWDLIPPSEYILQNHKSVEGFPEAVNPVGIPCEYGGQLDEKIIFGAQSQDQDGDMMSFNIKTGQGSAQDAFVDQEAEKEEVVDTNAGGDQGFDMFGANTETTSATVDTNVGVDTKGDGDSNAGVDANAGVEAAEESGHFTNFNAGAQFTNFDDGSNDPFSGVPGGEGQKLDWQPDDASLGNSECDEEEAERIAQRNKEHKERTLLLQQKDDDERTTREARKQSGRDALAQWFKEREEATQKQANKNKEEEWNTTQSMDAAKQSSNPWEVVTKLIDLKESNYKGAIDVSRMREVIIGKKNDA